MGYLFSPPESHENGGGYDTSEDKVLNHCGKNHRCAWHC